MDKNSIRNYAIWARQALMQQITEKAYSLGISKDEIKSLKQIGNEYFLDDIPIIKETKLQRDKLISKIKKNGYEQTIEEIAYTWFNRFIALRYMEVNECLPSKLRIFSSTEEGKLEPEILSEILDCNLDIDKPKVIKFKEENKIEELYRYILVFQCNELSNILPFLFEKINDYTELLLPDKLLNKDSVIMKLVYDIPEEDFKEVEIIGWLYQFYISEKKDEVFNNIKNKIKVSKENLPAATQLFTPKWIVKYMLENSLGRVFNGHSDYVKNEFKYYMEDNIQSENVLKQLENIKQNYKNISIENITILDPACGSGHILVYAFDLLYQLYLQEGYMEREIPKLIIENNLYGLDIDYRASQLSAFSIVMKGREKYKRFFKQIEREGLNVNITYIEETKDIDDYKYTLLEELDDKVYGKKQIDYVFDTFLEAKEYGSIIKIDNFDKDFWKSRLNFIDNYIPTLELSNIFEDFKAKLHAIYNQGIIMSKKYDIVCTNPPYLGIRKGMNSKLSKYVTKHFPNTRSDLFSVFIERCLNYSKKQGFVAMITQHSWMFLSSFEKLREHIIDNKTIVNMLHLGTRAFEDIGGEVVQTTSFVLFNDTINDFKGSYIRLIDYGNSEEKETIFLNGEEKYTAKNSDYYKIPGAPIVYWINDNIRNIFKIGTPLKEIAEPKQGMATTDNNRFLRYWTEININDIGFNFTNSKAAKESGLSWFPYNKGGEMRKWYGNNEYVVKYEEDGKILIDLVRKKYPKITDPEFVIKNRKFYFKKSITWSFVSSNNFGARCSPCGFIFDVGGSSLFPEDKDFYYILAFLSSKLAYTFLNILNPTMNFQVGNVGMLPIINTKDLSMKTEIESLAKECIEITKEDWDSFETSWDFEIHPLLKYKDNTNLIETAYINWENTCNNRFTKLKNNEEKINQLIINIYNLEQDMDYKLKDSDITIKKADLQRDVKSFMSYAVGCMFGRYSLDNLGLQYAGGKFDEQKYKTFKVSENNIIPILDDEYFEENILSKFINFIKITFGSENLNSNMEFIAQALEQKSDEKATETIRRYFLNDFYKDHLKMYNKRPIYWLFTSGKNKAFNTLIYIHRYNKNLIAQIRTTYLHKYQNILYSEENRLTNSISNDVLNKNQLKNYKKKVTKFKKYLDEIKKYDELLKHFSETNADIVLENGIKDNYANLKKLLSKI